MIPLRSTFIALPLAAALAAAPALAAPAKPVAKPAAAKPAAKAPTLPAPGTDPNGVTPAPVTFEQQAIMPADGPYLVRIRNVRGRIVVKPWNKNVVWVTATVRASRPLSGTALDYFKAAAMQVTRPEPDTTAIETVFRGVRETYPAVVAAKSANVEVEYMVAVPPEVAVEARQEYGPIVASGLDGRLDLFTRDGDVTVSDCKGWVDAGNERGRVNIAGVAGDAVGRSFHGAVTFKDVKGDVRAITSTGPVRVDVPARWVGEVSFHTVSGVFRSDLATFDTDLEPGDKGYVGVLRGPLASAKADPAVRVRVDTTSGEVTLASERAGAR
jgi:hypothetical protein